MEEIWEHLQTEQPKDGLSNLDIQPIGDILRVMNEENTQISAAIDEVLPDIEAAVELIVDHLQRGGRLIYIGAGTSGRLGVLDAAECPPTFNTPPELLLAIIAGGKEAMFEAVEESEDKELAGKRDLEQLLLSKKDVVVGITASGRTPYAVGALKYAGSVGAATISISCNRKSVISSFAQVGIEVNTGPEILMGSTRLKAGTAQKMVLNMLSTTSMIRLGKVYENLMVDLRATNHKLVERSKRIIMMAAGVSYEEAAEALAAADGHVKTAILMLKRQLSRESAELLLDATHGYLRNALHEPIDK